MKGGQKPMMNLVDWMIETYRKHAAAHEYWFGFVVAGMVYVVTGMTFEELSRYFKLDRASSKKGGFQKIRIRAKAAELAELAKNALVLGPESLLLIDGYNKGEALEKVITERFAGVPWSKDSVPFFVDGDTTINGKKVQIKFNGAELTNEKILRKYFPVG
jgi:hypothetical protein